MLVLYRPGTLNYWSWQSIW